MKIVEAFTFSDCWWRMYDCLVLMEDGGGCLLSSEIREKSLLGREVLVPDMKPGLVKDLPQTL